MKCSLALIALLLCACSTSAPHRPAAGPDLSGAIQTNQRVIASLTSAQEDNKAVKKAITALQASNFALHKLNSASLSNLDRADYKTSILLK